MFEKKIIIDTDLGGDIDDILALFVLMQQLLFDVTAPFQPSKVAITTTHIDAELKAQIANLILKECELESVLVFSGIDFKRSGSNANFKKYNSLFPAEQFGYPNDEKGTKKAWYPNHGRAYEEAYGKEFTNIKIRKNAPEYIVKCAELHSAEDKLVIVSIGPMHNIARALEINSSIAAKIKVVAMGGVYPKGYNWLIAPEITEQVVSKVETICITREFIEKNKLFITPEELQKIVEGIQSPFANTIIKDWQNWLKGDFSAKKNTYLFDPVTLYLAIYGEEITESTKKKVAFTCLNENGELKPEFANVTYNQENLENKIVTAIEDPNGLVSFVTAVRSAEKIKQAILDSITRFLWAAPKPTVEIKLPSVLTNSFYKHEKSRGGMPSEKKNLLSFL